MPHESDFQLDLFGPLPDGRNALHMRPQSANAKPPRDVQRRVAARFEYRVLSSPSTDAALFPDGVPIGSRARRKLFAASDVEDRIEQVWALERERYERPLGPPALEYFAIRKDARMPREGQYDDLRHTIKLDPVCATYGTILHELAHALVVAPAYENHGPEFIGTLIGLYRRHGGLTESLNDILEKAAQHGVRVDRRWIEGCVREE